MRRDEEFRADLQSGVEFSVHLSLPQVIRRKRTIEAGGSFGKFRGRQPELPGGALDQLGGYVAAAAGLAHAVECVYDGGHVADDEGEALFVSRNRRENGSVRKRCPDARELSLDDAVRFINVNYGDCFEWEVKPTSPGDAGI